MSNKAWRWFAYRVADFVGIVIALQLMLFVVDDFGNWEEFFELLGGLYFVWYLVTCYLFLTLFTLFLYDVDSSITRKIICEIWPFVIHSLIVMAGFTAGGLPLTSPFFLMFWSIIFFANFGLFLWFERVEIIEIMGNNIVFVLWKKHRLMEIVGFILSTALYLIMAIVLEIEGKEFLYPLIFISGYVFVIYTPSVVTILLRNATAEITAQNYLEQEFLYLIIYSICILFVMEYAQFSLSGNASFWISFLFYLIFKAVSFFKIEQTQS